MSHLTTVRKRVTRRRAIIGVLSLLLVVVLVAAACGEDATPTPLPATAVPAPTAIPGIPTGAPPTAVPDAPAPTAVPGAPAPTAMPDAPAPTAVPAPTAMPDEPSTGLRDRSEWTVDNPATIEEVEAELEKFRGDSLVFGSFGGAYQAAERQAFLLPFQEKFGIEIIEDSAPSTTAKVRAMAETGNIQWHVAALDMGPIWQLGQIGLLEELDKSVVDTRDFFDIVRTAPWAGGGGDTWASVVAYSTETYPEGGPQPQSWADIYDVAKFPGRRGFSVYWEENLYHALLSRHPELIETSESRGTLSPLTQSQIDEAFQILEDFKPNISVWWSAGSECPQLLISGEVDICTAWNGRIFDAQQVGAPMKICWECGFTLNAEAKAIPKGLKEQDPDKFELAQLFIAWTSFPEINAQMSRYISYGPINFKSMPFLEQPAWDQVRDELPSSSKNIPFAIIQDQRWTGDVADALEEQFQEFLQ